MFLFIIIVFCNLSLKRSSTGPTFVTAHTFCASGDTRVSYGIFLRGVKLCGENRT